MATYRLTVNESYSSMIEEKQAQDLDLLTDDGSSYHLIDKINSYKIQLLGFDINNKHIHVKLAGKVFDITIEDSFDILAKDLGLSAVVNKKIQELKSPMPGLVLEVMANPGDTVQEGDPLLILEAMKMENVIKSPADGIIKAVLVKQKEAIEKSQILIEFE